MSAPAGLLLTHGAGGGADHRLLVALEDQLSIPVRRMEFPYRAEGRKAPDRAPKLIASVIDRRNGESPAGSRQNLDCSFISSVNSEYRCRLHRALFR